MLMQQAANDIIEKYKMQPHPEGGYYKETYRSGGVIPHYALPERFMGDRCFATAIYFLLEQGNFSAFHRIKSDECWHFYAGSALLIYIIDINAKLQVVRLGANIFNDEVPQYVVHAGCWFAAAPAKESNFSFVGCTVWPGFDFADFELAEKNKMLNQYPQYKELVEKFTR
jgi:predicted cupin superfamily sugar epimerase